MATDPLVEVRRISNPSALALLTKDNKRILLLGDFHSHSDKEECKRCKQPSCLNYATILKQLDEYHTEQGTDLDVFVESFAPNDPKSGFNGLKQSTKDIFYAYQAKIYGLQIDLINLRKNLASKLYFHKDEPHIRYHYIDMRLTSEFEELGINLSSLLTISNEDDELDYLTKFKERFPTNSFYQKKVESIFFSKYSKQNPSRVAKQVSKLPSKEQQLLKQFFRKQATHLRIKEKQDSLQLDYIFTIGILMIDIYALARFMRFFSNQPEGSTSVFIEGAAHSFNYYTFLKLWGARVRTNIGFKGKFNQSWINKTLKRGKCLRVNFTRKLGRKN